MARKRTARGQPSRGFQTFDLVRDQHEVSGSGEGRRFLKHLDRRLQRFSTKIDSMEDRANRLSEEDDADLILAIESLHRETRLLRAEIRQHLAGRNRGLAEMTEYAEELWEQLKDTFEELKENLEQGDPSSRSSVSKNGSDDEDADEEWTWDEDDLVGSAEDWVASEIHPPRVGPKR